MTDTIIPTEPIQKVVNRTALNDEKSSKIIRKYTMISSGAALIPYDFIDVISSTASQTMMIRELCELYGVSYSNKMANVAFWSATGSVVTKVITTTVGAVISQSGFSQEFDLTGAAVAGIYTATVGEFYKLHLSDGGTLDDINLSDFTDYFIDEIKRGDLSLATFTNPSALMSHLNI